MRDREERGAKQKSGRGAKQKSGRGAKRLDRRERGSGIGEYALPCRLVPESPPINELCSVLESFG